MTFEIIPHASPDYERAVALREEILRKPLGLTFPKEELEREKDHIHIVGIRDGEIISTAVLVPEGGISKMQRVAVKESLQNTGIGSAMMDFCEAYAREDGFQALYCFAREPAVRFYEKLGYEKEGRYFNEDTIPHIKMEKSL